MRFVFDDGGRAASGRRGTARGDCVCRAIAIASGEYYGTVYDALEAEAADMRQTKRVRGSHPSKGVFRCVFARYLLKRGWHWHPTMGIGTGCRVHLRDGELPTGNLIVAVSRHLVAVIDGVIHDTYDPSRDGTRCVYGYWS